MPLNLDSAAWMTVVRRLAVAAGLLLPVGCAAATVQQRYYAHEAVLDNHGVIAPWYTGLNGQLDFRVRVAAETMKRFPWADSSTPSVPEPAPQWVYSGNWTIDSNGVIASNPAGWDGDVAQRSASMLFAFTQYYAYSGDASAKAMLSVLADRLIAHFQSEDDGSPWPRMLKSGCCYVVPFDKKSYPIMQLDLVAQVGTGIVRASQLCENPKWFEAAKRWGDLFAANCCTRRGAAPWGRYAYPESVVWNDRQTGGVAFVCEFLDELIDAGYRGADNAIVKARDAGRAYLRDVILPAWTVDDTWGRYYWDWENQVTAICPPAAACRYMMAHKDAFPNWKNDVRNILSLYINRTCTTESSAGEVYSGAWQYPESTGCCGKSLQYPTYEIAAAFAQYGAEADSEWAREIARRSMILVTYDAHPTGVVEDNIDGGQIVAGAWLNLCHPWPLRFALQAIGWMPDVFGANRENHIVRSSSVVTSVTYDDGRIAYATADVPKRTTDTLRLSFKPRLVTADGAALPEVDKLDRNGYMVKMLSNGDAIVTIRHDGARRVVVEGEDPQSQAGISAIAFFGEWENRNGKCRASSSAGASAEFTFYGNQVRVLGSYGPSGGIADVFLDGEKQLVHIDCWNPKPSSRQTIYYRSGLKNSKHTVKIVVRGWKNPLSRGNEVCVESVTWSKSGGRSGFGEGGGPTDTQRMIFGWTKRHGYTDSNRNVWMPGTEYVVRIPGVLPDVVAKTWWTEPRRHSVPDCADPELYLYGVHAPEFAVNVTVGPGRYHARMKFMSCNSDPAYSALNRCMTIRVNGREVATHFDPVATAGGWGRACDIVVNDIEPANGIIELRFIGSSAAKIGTGEAFVNAIEVGPGDGGRGDTPVRADVPQVSDSLVNGGFESGIPGELGSKGKIGAGSGWWYAFLSEGQSYIWPESEYVRHPDWGLPEFHSGSQALRTHTDGRGHTQVYQDVKVKPNANYTASVWVRAVDLRGKGFGADPSDSAGLIIREMDANGQVVADLGKVEVKYAGPYVQLSKTFVTSEKTSVLRFILDTVIACHYTEGHVTYDDAALEGPRVE